MHLDQLPPKNNLFRLWLAAIKPPMYSVAIMPIGLGSALAYAQLGQLNQGVFIVFLLSAICILAWTNISNDVFDAETGIDKNKPHSLVNLTGNREGIFWVGNFFLALGILGVIWISWQEKDMTVLGLILVACFLGYLYQGPPFRLGYQGWGEVLCFLSFGPIGVSAAYYSQTHFFSWQSLPAGFILGIVTSLILFCSHFHQVEDDRLAGKYSPVVRLGTASAAKLIPWICISVYGLILIASGIHLFPTWTLLSLISCPFAFSLCHLLLKYHDHPDQIKESKFIAVGLHFWLGLGLGAGFFLQELTGDFF
jgi:1,4-dihydroxy-2-naphthoate octaprenyltransferase